ncbi:hypothetical protein [Mangrovibacter phragmitis]|uniref:hypothetical protein n=1 Tax=Mangrovibacter phragmitis TaxID=1691903 RepID=UPI003369BF60
MLAFNIFIIALVIYIVLNQHSKLIKTRNELRQYADRMEAAELDLHAIRSVATNLLHNTGKELKKQLKNPDEYFLERLADDLIEVQHIVETRGPKTIGGQPYWRIEPQENSYKYGTQYPRFPD